MNTLFNRAVLGVLTVTAITFANAASALFIPNGRLITTRPRVSRSIISQSVPVQAFDKSMPRRLTLARPTCRSKTMIWPRKGSCNSLR
jgi:hypothetical protein